MQMPSKPQIAALAQSGRLTEAKAEGVRLCAQNASDPEAWLLLAGIHAQLGELNQVAECCQRAVALQPDNVTALFNLSVAQQMAGHLEEAARGYREALRYRPDYAQAHSNLGMVLRQLGQHDEAREHCEAAVRLNPGSAQAHNNLGLCLKDTGHAEQARDAFGMALRLNSGMAEAHSNLGLCHLAMGGLEEARRCFEEALRLKPDLVDACQNLGQVLMAQQQHERAVAIFRQLVRLRPDATAYHGLAVALERADGVSTNCLEEIVQCCRTALRQQPDFAEAHYHLGTCLMLLEQYDEARRSLERALALEPGYEDALSGLVLLEEQLGNFHRAMELLKPRLDQGTPEGMLAVAYAKVARHLGMRDKAIECLEHVLAGATPAGVQMEVHFALGKLLDERKEHDRAFAHYQRANELDPVHYDAAAETKAFDEIIDVFSAEKQARRLRASNRSQLPIFIVGMPRSGTTLVEQILASHPLVHGAGELRDMERIVVALPSEAASKLAYPACVDSLTRHDLDKVAQRHLNRLGQLAMGKSRVTDKMPHNFMHLGLIDLLFPGARVIHCTRDPVDTCVSIYFQQFNRGHAYASNLKHLGLHYRQYRRLMRHWQGTLRIPILEVNYEKLVADFEPQCRSLVEFCGLEWDERCLSFHTAKREVGTYSYDQVRRPLYTTSVARWKRYEKHLGPLLTALGDEIQTVDTGTGTAPAVGAGS